MTGKGSKKDPERDHLRIWRSITKVRVIIMGKYVAKRLGMALVTIFLVTCLTFLLMNAVPGSPWLSEKAPSEATLAALNAKYGMDKQKQPCLNQQ